MDELEKLITQQRPRIPDAFSRSESGGEVSMDFTVLGWYRGNGPGVTVSSYKPLLQRTTSFRSGPGYDEEVTPQGLIRDNWKNNLHPYDNGHEFVTEREHFKSDHNSYTSLGYEGSKIIGPLMPVGALNFIAEGTFDSRNPFNRIDINEGTHFLAALRPTKAAANVAQALIETVRDIPRLPFLSIETAFRKSQLLRKGADEYLNLVFGWSPLVQDVLKICRAVVFADSILQQYRRDSGKQIRRRRKNPTLTEYFETSEIENHPTTHSSYGDAFRDYVFENRSDSRGTLSRTVKTEYTYSFSGAYTYLLTGGDELYEKSARYGQLASKLLGIRVDIQLLWELAPWSWLADWFTDIGDFIDINNSIAMDNLVIRYGYLMREARYTSTWTHTGVKPVNGPHTGPLHCTYTRVRKERVRATPYGFGLNPESLSEAQWSILGALGLTKTPRRFAWG